MSVLAELIGTTRRNIYRWKIEGIPEPSADQAAAMLGVHPSWIWGQLWWDNA